jgi:hypothetical protein
MRTVGSVTWAGPTAVLAVALALGLACLMGGCSSSSRTSGLTKDSTSRQRQPEHTASLHRQRERAQRACVRQAHESRTGTVTCGLQTVVCNKSGTFRVDDSKGYYKVVCRGNQYVGLAWDSDHHHYYRRVRYLGRSIGNATPPGQGTRLARPVPPTPPAPPNPPSSGGLIYSTDNDHGYTGPRCYAPGGYYFTPC